VKRSRESSLSGIHYGFDLKRSFNRPEPRFVRLYRWWDGCTSDPIFWKLVIYGSLLGICIVGAVFL
jgi:hypothetical protein